MSINQHVLVDRKLSYLTGRGGVTQDITQVISHNELHQVGLSHYWLVKRDLTCLTLSCVANFG